MSDADTASAARRLTLSVPSRPELLGLVRDERATTEITVRIEPSTSVATLSVAGSATICVSACVTNCAACASLSST
jgi:hypothetical protein